MELWDDPAELPAVCLKENRVVTWGLMYTSSLCSSPFATQTCGVLAAGDNDVVMADFIDFAGQQTNTGTLSTLQSTHSRAHHADKLRQRLAASYIVS